MIPLDSSTTFPALGTTASLLVSVPGALEAASEVLRRELDAIDRTCSRFRSDSELAAVNAASGRAVRVSPLLLEAVEVALWAARVTDGRVDPTVGETMRVLGYDRDFAQIDRDGPAVRIDLQPVPGWLRVRVDRSSSSVQLPVGVVLDLGATAKALCADRAAVAAGALTGSGVLVSLGGDIAVAGEGPRGGWRIRVTHDHAAGLDAPGRTVAITSGGLATSSTSVRRWSRGGQTMHHLIDPATGLPAAECWRTVSVAAASCVTANVASTAAIVLGSDAPAWLARQRLPAPLVDPAGAATVVAGWPDEEIAACP